MMRESDASASFYEYSFYIALRIKNFYDSCSPREYFTFHHTSQPNNLSTIWRNIGHYDRLSISYFPSPI